MVTPALQVVPLKPKTRPSESTARQKVVVGHDTPVRPEALVPVTAGSVTMGWGAEKPGPVPGQDGAAAVDEHAERGSRAGDRIELALGVGVARAGSMCCR